MAATITTTTTTTTAEAAEEELRVFFLPFMSPGHMIPMLEMATLFARRGVSATIITTPGNESIARPTTDASASCRRPIQLLLLPLPTSATKLLPPGTPENLAFIPRPDFNVLYQATYALGEPLLHLLRRHPLPHCLVSDAVFSSWSIDVADELGIIHVIFDGPGAFALCVQESLERQGVAAVDGDITDRFVVDDIPHSVELTRGQIPELFTTPDNLYARRAAERRSFGVLINSFRELEPEYAELYLAKRRGWLVGPLALCHRDDEASKAGRGHPGQPEELSQWLSFLDGRPEGSVLYVCFGSISETEFTTDHLRKIAAGLAASGHPFIWAAKGVAASGGGQWLAEAAEGKGLIRTGWAPQVVMLNHPAVGGFLTHCGWNSTLEAVAAGVPMATVPGFYDQFINERLVTEVLGIGVRVRRRADVGGSLLLGGKVEVEQEEVTAAVRRVMGEGEEAEGMRRRAREYAAMARAAMEEGGSSVKDLDRLIAELVAFRAERKSERGM